MQVPCSRELAVSVRGEEEQRLGLFLFACLISFLTKSYAKQNLKLRFFCLICQFGMVENQNSQRRVIYGSICG